MFKMRWFANEGRYSVERLSTYIQFVPLMTYGERNPVGQLFSFGSQTFMMSLVKHIYYKAFEAYFIGSNSSPRQTYGLPWQKSLLN